MSKFIRTAQIESKVANLEDIKQIILDLPYTNDQFLILDKDDDYMQTCINYGNSDIEMYTVEIRKHKNDKEFNHYQCMTNDVMKVITDFRNYFNDKDVQLDLYADITHEF